MNLNGELNILLHLLSQDKQGKQGEKFYLNKLDINLARPNLAKKMLVGQTPEEAISRVTQLMTVCQHAQTAAAKLALGYVLTQAEKLAIDYENIEQGFWRLVIDLPPLLEVELSLSEFIKLRQAIAKQSHSQQSQAQIGALAEQLFSELCQLSTNEFVNLSSSALQQWLDENQSPMANCLRKASQIMVNELDNQPNLLSAYPDDELLATLAQLLQAEGGFHEKPHIHQYTCETGTLSMMQNHPHFEWLATSGSVGRFVSRLLYLAQTIDGLSSIKSSSAGFLSLAKNKDLDTKEFKLAWVQTARGLLVHLANIQAGKISQYSIVAPTEWNFHPAGSLSRAFVGSSFSSAALVEKSVKLAVLALDPCIEFKLGVAYA